jgi:hypothetical protein
MKAAMSVNLGHIESIHPVMLDALRRMTPRERLARAHDMWRYARARVEAAVRSQHPDWPEQHVLDEIRRRMLGSG